VSDIKDSNLLGTIVNPVEKTVFACSNPPPFFELAAEEFRAGRPRILRQ
jgi:hypothetical protein